MPHPDTTSLAALGWTDRWAPFVDDRDDRIPGRIVRHDGSAVLVATEFGTGPVRLRPATPALAVGDWVLVGDGTVSEVLPRASSLKRRDPSTGESQLIAANVDVVGIVCGLDRPVSIGRIQRFTSLAWDAGAAPLVILAKADLVEDAGATRDAILNWDPGSDIVTVSAVTNDGVADLLERCADRTLVLVGESGAGKSTLLNLLAGTELSTTGGVREGDHKGRHTTTARQLHLLPGNCRLIDTPGVREVGLATDVDTIDQGFADIAELAEACRFGDCSHAGEPGCSVLAAVGRGELDPSRLASWSELRREAAAAEVRADPAARHKADRRMSRVYREAQQIKRDRR
jgi:ribosome biogenesis GTPase